MNHRHLNAQDIEVGEQLASLIMDEDCMKKAGRFMSHKGYTDPAERGALLRCALILLLAMELRTYEVLLLDSCDEQRLGRLKNELAKAINKHGTEITLQASGGLN